MSRLINKKLMGVTLAGAIAMIGTGAAAVSGAGFFDYQVSNGVNNTVKASFTPSASTTGVNGLGLVSGKNVKQAWVRLQEGDYDSGVVKSTMASSKTDDTTYETSTSKFNNPLQTAYTSHGWVYFSQ